MNVSEELAKIREELKQMSVQMAVYNESLKQHMMRTEQVEKQIEKQAKVFNFVEIGFKVCVVVGILTTVAKNVGWI